METSFWPFWFGFNVEVCDVYKGPMPDRPSVLDNFLPISCFKVGTWKLLETVRRKTKKSLSNKKLIVELSKD